LRNDGIGGTPRLARYTSIGTPPGGKKDHDPTPNRPPLPRRTPGETDLEQDPRFRLVGARAAAPALKPDSGQLPVDHPVVRRAREIVSTHLIGSVSLLVQDDSGSGWWVSTPLI
jgi:hypothetical protein